MLIYELWLLVVSKVLKNQFPEVRTGRSVCGIHNEWVTGYSFGVELGMFSGDRLLMVVISPLNVVIDF